MLKKERAERVLQRLEELYPETPIPLDHSDPFTLLVAVVLSAQCTDKKVNEITPELFRQAPTAKAMWDLGEANVLEIIRPLGLSKQKAKALVKLSEIIETEHGGAVPESFDKLELLPGVGHKTASVVMSQAFGHPAFPVDTHIHRLAQRWGLTNGKDVAQTEADLKKLFPKTSWNKLHLQIIFYGREHCSARGCDGTRCAICQELYPNRKRPFVAKKP
ncbi:endonuclease III [Rhodopirellula sp. MGV]|uniref:endonuclease III n=1 Tax=Rhodopirellula sp. MGV TaxID=2023130 RepID=UPI000B97A8F1|nr:endonuclease III [Rhodopirellula sp. MGV]OYP38030.1 endonuclease III [Rhodopirellula sp. MGV]PNY36143.1 endonuclease III [Rhodopirellula baltica]